MTLSIKSCSNCPLVNNDNEFGPSCNYPDAAVKEEKVYRSFYDNLEAPTECPLRKELITIQFS